jgi:hypothetical protein
MSDKEPRIWLVQSLANAGGRGPMVRNDARLVPESELALWKDHPATLLTTTITMPNTDVRTLSNSLRTMFTDANTQQVIPVGSCSLIITGFSGTVLALSRLLHEVDEVTRAHPTVPEPEPARKPAK